MKYERFIIFATLNALVIMITSNLLVSCQKHSIQNSGFYSNKISRDIASSKNKKLIDPLQVMIYCKVSTINTKACYQNLSHQHNIKTEYLEVQHELEIKSLALTSFLSKEIENYSLKRKNYCKKNSLHNFKKCMHSKDTKVSIDLLNQISKQAHFNGYEYIFTKNLIRQELIKQLKLVTTVYSK
ncbi:MAG: hypothetical protein N4A33_02315 [Bacteriovoracaceae bacterium]|jgi:hypothetical protein|nr:hypothetical protein [Bacteriovoracaceae bacterium]